MGCAIVGCGERGAAPAKLSKNTIMASRSTSSRGSSSNMRRAPSWVIRSVRLVLVCVLGQAVALQGAYLVWWVL